jgi:hypothetical protein
MKHLSNLFQSLAGVSLVGMVCLSSLAHAQTASQAITLAPGWNAVWLEVESVYPSSDAKAGQAKAPEDVFSNPAVTIVASPKQLAGSAEFFGNEPGALTPTSSFNQDEWLQWKRSDPADMNNLTSVFGNRPYLVFATGSAPISLVVTGKVRFYKPTWNPDRYNLLGFGLEGTRTFTEFFSASGTTHPVTKIFALAADGSWAKVNASATMQSGVAYWIFSNGPSTYTGPVSLDFYGSITGVLDYGSGNDAETVGTEKLDLEELTFTNVGTDSATPSATAVSIDPGLSLFRVTPATSGIAFVRGNGFLASFVPVAGKNTVNLTVGAKRTFTDATEHFNVYRLRTGAMGASFYLPVRAVLSSVAQTAAEIGALPSGPMSGLWVGNVVLDAATSIVVNGAPVQPTAGKAPMRLILHVDGSGQVRLLSQVTMMQTKSADPSVASLPVLVVDQAKIPFFEGIKERNGKRAGLRIESVSYDMPRSASAWTGADLLTFTTRPTTLKEEYDLSRSMTGTMGQTLTTSIVLDPFHRSNPMRHAYHQELSKGPKITRVFTVAFDAQQAQADSLTGTFTETISGLIKDNLTVSGRMEMRRISTVETLDNAQ